MSFLAALGTVASAVLPGVGDFIGEKYRSDLQGHQIDRQNEFNANQNAEAFARTKAWDLEKYNMEVAQENQNWQRQVDYNNEMWNKTNEYNSPASQMERMKAAGLNPNLMYGQGTTGITTTIKAPDLNTPSVGDASLEPVRSGRVERGPFNFGGDVLEGLKGYFSIKNADLENRNLAAMNSLIQQQAMKTNWEKGVSQESFRALKRENDLLEGTGFGKSDPAWYRLGGRIGRWLKGNDNSRPGLLEKVRRVLGMSDAYAE